MSDQANEDSLEHENFRENVLLEVVKNFSKIATVLPDSTTLTKDAALAWYVSFHYSAGLLAHHLVKKHAPADLIDSAAIYGKSLAEGALESMERLRKLGPETGEATCEE